MLSLKKNVIFTHVLAIAFGLILALVYFSPQLEGKVTKQGDIIHHKGASKELVDHKDKTGHHSLWTNSMFSGMPTYQISIDRGGNLLTYITKLGRLWIGVPTGLFITMFLATYLLFVLLGVSPWLALIGAISTAFATNNFVLWEAGHSSKLNTLSYTGLIIAGMILSYRNKLFLGGTIFTLGLALSIFSNHPQMTYYLGLVCLIYVIITAIKAFKEKTISLFIKQSAVLVVGVILAVAGSYSQLWTSYEYNKDTMRGDPILISDKGVSNSSSSVKGLDWNYAMEWSNGWMDNLSIFIPGAVGGGSREPISKTSAFNKALKKRGAKRMEAAPLYWGSLPFTSGPAYLGAIMMFLFILGLFLEKGRLKWWIGLSVLLTLLMGMGKHFEFFNKLLFNTLPLLNNFRTPNSILSLTSFILPILSIVTLSNIVQKKYASQDVVKSLKWTFGILGGICLFVVILGPSLFSFEGLNDQQIRSAGIMDELILDRQSLMRSDAFRSLALIGITAGLLWFYINDKIKLMPVVIGLLILTVFDHFSVGKRYLNSEDFVKKNNYQKIFKPRPVDQQILNDKAIHYRVHDMSINTFNSSASSYYHHTIGGYSAAKLQRYQDLIEHHIAKGNENVLNMLNMKYLITREQQVHQNPNALGNAWFVDRVKFVQTANEEIEALTNFSPAQEAIVHQEFTDLINDKNTFSPNGQIVLESYTPDEMRYNSNTNGEQLAVFSEIWYGPNKGWNAYIDGKKTDLFRVNYALRGLLVPSGSHEIVMKFEPRSFVIGQNISFIASLLIALLLLLLIYSQFKPIFNEEGKLEASE